MTSNSFLERTVDIGDLHDDFKTYMKDKLETTDEFKEYYKEITQNIIPKSYAIVHIRNGDPVGDYEVSDINLRIIDNAVKNIKYDSDIYVLGDNKYIVRYLSKKYNWKSLNTGEICHLGNRNSVNDDRLKNTLVEFFFIANSAKVFQLTQYFWASGFVAWPCKIYDVPFELHKYYK